MRKKNRRTSPKTVEKLDSGKSTALEFTFGDAVPMLDRREMLDYIESWFNGRWYEPPVDFYGLSKSFRANVHHSSALYTKRNILASTFIPHKLLSREAFNRFSLDHFVFGNSYLEERKNRLGGTLRLDHSMALYMRRGKDPDSFFFVRGWQQEHEFEKGSIFHLQEPDITQEVYGLPEYLSALQSAWLNEAATLFRRKYYLNGSHAGFILYLTDAAHDQRDVDALREAMKNSKGPGNFRNAFMYAPNGKKDGIQLIPISEVAAKDDFFNIKNVTREDVIVAHRVPPQLLSLVPHNSGGFGPVEPAAKVFARNELQHIQDKFTQLNDWIGEEVMRFKEYEIPTTS